MSADEFEALDRGDCIRNEATGETLMVSQVRFPGFYAVVPVDPKTFDRTSEHLTVLRSGEGFVLARKAPAR